MAWVVVGVAVTGTAVSIMGNNAAARNQKAQIAQQQYNQRVQMSFNEEAIKTEIGQIDLNFDQQYMQRLESYNQMRNTQLVGVGYQGRTMSSISAVQKADDLDFEYDNKIDEMNRNLSKKAAEIGISQQNLGLQRDIASGDMAKSAVANAAKWQNIGAVMQGASTSALAYNQYNYNNPSNSPAKINLAPMVSPVK